MQTMVMMGGLLTLCLSARSEDGLWHQAEHNGRQTQEIIGFCNRYAQGWLSHADTSTGLLPRRLNRERFWNSKDCAADNYPFLVLTAYITDNYYLKRAVLHILEQERRLTSRVDSLPDTFDFATQQFVEKEAKMPGIIFGASEYAKDGLLPVTEWLGPGPWLDRMTTLVKDIWKHATIRTEMGMLPTDNIEVSGDLLETMSRLYWLTGDEDFKRWSFLLADHYLLHYDFLGGKSLHLRDHGCEIIAGLSEAYLIAAKKDPARREAYRPPLHAILDRILDKGVNEDGMMPNAFNPKTGEASWKMINDGWGYVYNAFLTVAEIDEEPRYREAVAHALRNVHKYLGANWENGSADGYADSVEGAINLLNRIPVSSAFAWADNSMRFILDKQRHDGIIEAWHGDGNSARTALMYALWKTQGVTAAPWREDLQLGSVRAPDGSLRVSISSEYSWSGQLRFDRPRHRDYFKMPFDYARINQFPEWFTADAEKEYTVTREDSSVTTVHGKDLWQFPLNLEPGKPARLTFMEKGVCIPPNLGVTQDMLRSMRYTSRGKDNALAWQVEVKTQLAQLLGCEDLVVSKKMIPFRPKTISEEKHETYIRKEIEFNSTPQRRIRAVVTIPKAAARASLPAVVCIHGHGGNRGVVYEAESIYKGFATELARRGVVTIATDVGQHEVYEAGRTLMGERLWDLMRCVDYLLSMKEVDRGRIGCAGLSLGGEMAMWLGAMDTRIQATVSAGFLTFMDQMEHNHCMCWKFDGLRERVDFPDIYSLIAPRALQCQNGRLEPLDQFPVPLAKKALEEVSLIYDDLGQKNAAMLAVHEGGHEVDVPTLLALLIGHLSAPPESDKR